MLSHAPITEKLVFDRQGSEFHFVKEQNVDAMLPAIHELRDMVRKDTGPGRGRFLGSVPILVAQIWAKESGTAIGTREWLKYAKMKLKSSDWQKLRVHGA